MSKLNPNTLSHAELLHYLPLETADPWALRLYTEFNRAVKETVEERSADLQNEIDSLERELDELKAERGR